MFNNQQAALVFDECQGAEAMNEELLSRAINHYLDFLSDELRALEELESLVDGNSIELVKLDQLRVMSEQLALTVYLNKGNKE